MSQISMPIRIVLAFAVILMAAWMTILKPKSADPVAPQPAGNLANGTPAVSAPGKLAESAKTAVQNANAKSAADEAAANGIVPGSSTTTPSTTAGGSAKPSAGAKPTAATVAGVPKPIAKAVAADKVIVLLFWNRDSADDRAVKAAVGKVDRWNGRVMVASEPVDAISRYGRIARGVDVEQSPTVVVIDRDLKATSLVGYVDTQSIDQAVVDAMRASGGIFTSAYLRKVNALCATAGRQVWAVPQPDTATDLAGYVKRQNANAANFVAGVRAIPAPARYRAFARANAADFAALSAVHATLARSLQGHPGKQSIVRSINTATSAEAPVARRLDARMDKQHVLSCGSNG